jgi:hypothetical protein
VPAPGFTALPSRDAPIGTLAHTSGFEFDALPFVTRTRNASRNRALTPARESSVAESVCAEAERPRSKNGRVGRSTIARILKAHGLPPVPDRPTSWQTFLRSHWGAIAGADFFTTEVWTWRGLVTYYTVLVIDLASRRVQIVGSTPFSHHMFMQQVVRTMTAEEDGLLVQHRLLICDRDTKWSAPVRARLEEAGIRVVQTPHQAPNANAYAERCAPRRRREETAM